MANYSIDLFFSNFEASLEFFHNQKNIFDLDQYDINDVSSFKYVDFFIKDVDFHIKINQIYYEAIPDVLKTKNYTNDNRSTFLPSFLFSHLQTLLVNHAITMFSDLVNETYDQHCKLEEKDLSILEYMPRQLLIWNNRFHITFGESIKLKDEINEKLLYFKMKYWGY